MAGADRGEDSLPSWRPQPDGEASRTEEVDGTWDPAGTGRGEQGPTRPSRRPPQGPPLSSPSQDFSFIEVSGGRAQGSGWAIGARRGRGWWNQGLSNLSPGGRKWVVGEGWWPRHVNRGLRAARGVRSQLTAVEGLMRDAAGPQDSNGSGVAAVPNRTPRFSTVPCIGTVPTWGASVGTGPRPSGPVAPWACQRRPTRTHACFRTLRVGPTCRLMSVSVSGVCQVGGPGDAACADPALTLQSHELLVCRLRTRRWWRSLRTAGHGCPWAPKG